MKKEPRNIVVRMPANDMERNLVIAYISAHMRRKHGGCPPEEKTPATLVAAFENKEVIGALGMQFGDEGKPLTFEEQFAFPRSGISVPYLPEQTVYYSRWNSSRPSLGLVIWFAASEYAINRGMIFSSATGKNTMLEFYKIAFGCIWHPIRDATIREASVGESERSYFFDTERPAPWLGVIEDQIAELRNMVPDIQKLLSVEIDI